ncbi:hypothetical protein [Burkholderia ubonensis]|uniref:hypothetical protein n=1 Tax=Burkholderia ubonensis TaxID=101571 RepID=UPI0009B2E755|nr:hypothetical protein [Burkholderia ubonensis]
MTDIKEIAGVSMNARGSFAVKRSDTNATLGALAFASDLGRLLVRIKAGQQATAPMIRLATLLIAQMIRNSGRFKRGKFLRITREELPEKRNGHVVDRVSANVIDRFAFRVLTEWIDNSCQQCTGRGIECTVELPAKDRAVCSVCVGARRLCVFEERIPFAAGKNGPLVFREYKICDKCLGAGGGEISQQLDLRGRRICAGCRGSGRSSIDEVARASNLGVTLDEYRRNWSWRFRDMLAMLDRIDGEATRIMLGQLRD